jgi:hypothetical protein
VHRKSQIRVPIVIGRLKAAAISLPFVWIAVRETKGKTLEQMKDTTNLNRFLGPMKGTQG